MSEEIKLKPCPFCGGEAEITKIGNDYTKTRKILIKCKKCAVQRTQKALRYSLDWLKDKVVEAWNTRHQPEQQEERICTQCSGQGKQLEQNLPRRTLTEAYPNGGRWVKCKRCNGTGIEPKQPDQLEKWKPDIIPDTHRTNTKLNAQSINNNIHGIEYCIAEIKALKEKLND